MRNKTLYIYVHVGIAWLLSCCSSTPMENIQKFIGERIVLPKTLELGSDSLPDRWTDSVGMLHPKLMLYYSAEVCSSCKMKELYRWQARLTDSLATTVSKVRCLCIIHTSTHDKREMVQQTIADYRLQFPVLLDTAGIFERSNPQLPENPVFHTFLLDRDNRVVLVGSPIGNPKMWELYKSTIDRLVENGGILPKRDTCGYRL